MIIGVVILLCSLLLARKRGSENLVAILLKMLFYLVFLNYERVFSF